MSDRNDGLARDVVGICSNLIRFDTTNFGPGSSRGEAECARYIADLLARAGYEATYLESAPGRANVVVRVAGTNHELPAVLAHAHLDVVPAEAADWSFGPFSGTVQGGFVHGRGAVDMKDFAAVLVAVLLEWAESRRLPERDVVVAFVADEEVRGEFGAQWLVDWYPELFAGVETAIGESGGRQIRWPTGEDEPAVNFYPVAVAERGTAHLRLTARGTAGHGSRTNPDNAVVHLVAALARLSDHRWPVMITDTMAAFLDRTSDVLGIDLPCATDEEVAETLDKLGPLASVVDRTFRVSTTPTVLAAGYKTNVVPETATADVDVRLLPGSEESTMTTIDRILGPHVSREFLAHESPVQSTIGGELYSAIRQTMRSLDPAAVLVPFCTGGGSDAKAFARLGIECYGFAPSCPSDSGEPGSGEHGVDEKVPVASLHFAMRVLDVLLTDSSES